MRHISLFHGILQASAGSGEHQDMTRSAGFVRRPESIDDRFTSEGARITFECFRA